MEKHRKYLCPIRKTKESFGAKPAIIYKEIALSYDRFDNLIDQIAERLSPFTNSKIALYSKNSINLIITLFACFRRNITPVMINNRWPLFQIEQALDKLDCKLFISDTPTVFLLDTPSTSFEKLFENRSDSPSPAHIDQNTSILLFTSSSTKIAKACKLNLRGLVIAATNVSEKIELTNESKCYLNLPLFHVAGFSMILRTFLKGGSLILQHDLESDLLNFDITHISMVPTQLHRLLLSSKKVLKKATLLTSILVGGAPISRELLIRAQKAQLPIHITYGMTELGSSVFIEKKPHISGENLYLGFPLTHLQAAVGEDQELFLKGFSLFDCYYQEGLPFTPFTKTGWFQTNDLVQFHEEKGFAIIGRKDNQFISGGENIQPEQIEREIMSLTNVIQAIVVPIKDKEYGQRPVAFIDTTDQIDNLKRMLEKRLPKYKIPTHFFDLNQLTDSQMKWKRGDLIKIAEDFLMKKSLEK